MPHLSDHRASSLLIKASSAAVVGCRRRGRGMVAGGRRGGVIYELATIEVKGGTGSAFEAAVQEAGLLFQQAAGFRSLSLLHSIEHPLRYHLIIGWETVENHMVDFRGSDAFGRWRELIGPHLASAPVVEHAHDLLGSGAASSFLSGSFIR